MLGPCDGGKELAYPLLHGKATQTFVPAECRNRCPVTLARDWGRECTEFTLAEIQL